MSAGACSKHGPQESWDIVCMAIGDALKDRKSVGFVWGVGNSHWAICSVCDDEIGKGHARPHQGVPLCHACFMEAWELNGKPEQCQ